MQQRDGDVPLEELIPEEQEPTSHRSEPRRRNALNYVLIVAVALLLFWNVIRFLQEREDKEAAQTNAVTLADQVRAACEDPTSTEFDELDPICRQAEDIAANPVQPVAIGPSDTQVEVALVNFCAVHDECVGRTGRPGRDGIDGTSGLDGVPGINGIDGKNGLDGSDGLNGSDGSDGLSGSDGAPGADAPPPTQEQVNAAVAAICTANPDVCRSLIPGPPSTPCPDGYQQVKFVIDESPPVGLPAGTYLVCSKL